MEDPMTSFEDIRKTVTESRPMRAAVGATDLAVERARDAWEKASSPEAKEQAKERLSRVQKSVGEKVTGFDPQAFRGKVERTLDPKALQSTASRLPGWAVSGMIQVAGKAEAQYESLAERGKGLLDRAKNDPHAQDLMGQGKQAMDRTRTAVVSVRKKMDDGTVSARSAMGRGRDAAVTRIPGPSAPAEPAEDTSPSPDPRPASSAATDERETEQGSRTPVATPPKKASPTRKKTTSGASSTPRAKKTASGTSATPRTKKATTKRSPSDSGGSSTAANGRARTTPPPDTASQ
jgi:hypothetical protein